jgi:site-specific DNA-methyltransferase (cytosine-N4-specific)
MIYLDPKTEEYLSRWFPSNTLEELRRALTYSRSLPADDRLVSEVLISNRLREYSWQDPEDLRIRRRDAIPQRVPLLNMVVKDLREEWSRRDEWSHSGHTDFSVSALVFHGDSQRLRKVRGSKRVAGTVCSPPYATALPYVDTYRLSLVALGLVEHNGIAALEHSIIGARDVVREDRLSFSSRVAKLPIFSQRVVENLAKTVEADAKAGFRKRALPFALTRYLSGVQRVLGELRKVEGQNSPNLWIVGPNRTTIAGQVKDIPTPRLLGDLAEAEGFHEISYEILDAYGRYSLHSKNSIRSETLVTFYS